MDELPYDSNLDETPLVQLIRHELKVRRLRVANVEYPTPRLARLTLQGDSLFDFVSLAPDDHIKLLFPGINEKEPVLPQVSEGRVLWGVKKLRAIARDYTPTRFDRARRELVVDMVLHEGGYASKWAQNARKGDILGVAGPRGSHVVTRALRKLLLVGDETALPAITRWLAELTEFTTAHVFIEVANELECQPLPTRANAQVCWRFRDASKSATHCHLLDTIRSTQLPLDFDYAWIAGESSQITALSAHLRKEYCLTPRQLSARGYWKRGVRDHQEPHED